MDIDETYIKTLLFSLKKIVGSSFPNPPVASLIVESNTNFSNNKIVSFGFTSPSGRPHAEFNAIQNVNLKKNKKYTLYSTLEPCCHEGRGISCVTKIIEAKFINRVVFSVKDPDKRVNGRGKEELQKKNIKVRYGLCEKEAIEIYKGYFLNRKIKRPRVFLKLATTLDGYISITNARTVITGNVSNKYSQILRSQMDAILVGSNTLKVDNSLLTCRLNGLKKLSPIRVVLSRKLDLNKNLRIFKDCNSFKTIVFTEVSDKSKISLFSKLNVEIIVLDKEKYNLKNILNRLSFFGVCNLLVEGGSQIFTSFLKEKLFDDIFIFRSNFFLGNSGFNATGFDKFNFSNIKLKKKTTMTLGNDTLEIFQMKNK